MQLLHLLLAHPSSNLCNAPELIIFLIINTSKQASQPELSSLAPARIITDNYNINAVAELPPVGALQLYPRKFSRACNISCVQILCNYSLKPSFNICLEKLLNFFRGIRKYRFCELNCRPPCNHLRKDFPSLPERKPHCIFPLNHHHIKNKKLQRHFL